MTTLAPELERAIDAREGRELLHYLMSGPVLSGGARVDVVRLASGASVVKITGLRVLKVGLFYGMFGAVQVLEGDLHAIAERFGILAADETFVPPIRLDHGYSVRDVIGWHDDLRAELGIDETVGEETTYLVADVTITGSVEYTPAQIIDAIKRGALRNRSSELGSYTTNAGLELSLVYYGVAFVDIPAVEGLGPVPLRRSGSPRELGGRPASVVELREDPPVTGTATTTQTPPTEPTPAATTDAPPAGDPPTTDLGEETVGDTPPAATQDLGEETVDEPGDDETPPAATPTPPGDELAEARAEIVRLRTENATTELERHAERGVVVPATREAALALLSHDDEAVRTAARTLLAQTSPPVDLGRRSGTRTLSARASAGGGSATSSTGDGSRVIELGMTPDEAGARWAALTTEERKAREGEYEEWRRDHFGLND